MNHTEIEPSWEDILIAEVLGTPEASYITEEMNDLEAVEKLLKKGIEIGKILALEKNP